MVEIAANAIAVVCYRSSDGSGFAIGSKHDFSPDPRLGPGESIRYTKEFLVPHTYGPVEIFTDVRDDASTSLEVLPRG